LLKARTAPPIVDKEIRNRAKARIRSGYRSEYGVTVTHELALRVMKGKIVIRDAASSGASYRCSFAVDYRTR